MLHCEYIDNGKPVSNLKLQKILYYAQAAFLVKNRQLFDDEISAWKYGPVVEHVYYYFRKNSDRPILEKVPDNEFKDLDMDTKKEINRVLEAKRKYSAFDLVRHTHAEIPWQNARAKGSNIISKTDIKTYFKENIEAIYR